MRFIPGFDLITRPETFVFRLRRKTVPPPRLEEFSTFTRVNFVQSQLISSPCHAPRLEFTVRTARSGSAGTVESCEGRRARWRVGSCGEVLRAPPKRGLPATTAIINTEHNPRYD